MPKLSDFFPGKYLKAGDLNGQEKIATIDRVEVGQFENDGKKQTKPIVFFRDGLKPMVINKTNFAIIAAACGDDSDGWAGRRIALSPDTVAFGGRVQETIKVRRAPAQTETGRAAKPAQ
jgi:hypothetical protein